MTIAQRKAATKSMPPFREASELLNILTRLVTAVRGIDAGRRYAEAWEEALIVRNLGSRRPRPTPDSTFQLTLAPEN